MNKLLPLIFSCALFFGLDAAQFRNAIVITPTGNVIDNQAEYHAFVKIEKIGNNDQTVLAMPELLCLEGKTALIDLVSKDGSNQICVSILVPKDEKRAVSTILIRENQEVALEIENNIAFAAN